MFVFIFYWYCCGDDFCQFFGMGYWLNVIMFDDCVGDMFVEMFFVKGFNYSGDIVFFSCLQLFGCGLIVCWIYVYIQWFVMYKGKVVFCIVKLWGRDVEIEQNVVDFIGKIVFVDVFSEL